MTSELRHAARSATAYQEYGQDLANALEAPGWIHDPSYALGQDPDVYAKVSRDPVVAHAIRYRKHLAAGREWRVEPASDSPSDTRAAEIVRELIEKVQGFTDARIRQGSAIFRGSAYQFMEGGRSWERIADTPGSWWVPRALRDVDRRRFRLAMAEDRSGLRWEFWSVTRRAWEPLEHPEWFVRTVFDDTEDSLGYGSGLLDTLYRWQAVKSQRMQNMGRACERFSNGFVIVKVDSGDQPTGRPSGGPSRSPQTRAQAAMQAFQRHRTDDVLAIDSKDDVVFVNGLGEGWGVLTDAIGYYDTNMVMAVLGSTLATMQSLGEVGSNAKAKEHASSTESLLQADRARLGEDLTLGLVGMVWRMNRWLIQQLAPGASMPSLRIGQQKQEDPTVAAGVVSVLRSAGVPLLKAEVYSKTGFSQPSAEDDVFDGPAPQEGGQAPGESPLSQLLQQPTGADPVPEGGGDVQDSAMNGAQVQALQGVVQSVADGFMPEETAVQLIVVAFPLITEDKARAMLAPVRGHEAPQIQPEGSQV